MVALRWWRRLTEAGSRAGSATKDGWANGDFFDDTFDRTVKAAVAQARRETLAAGVPFFYHDSVSGRDVMERPDGRVFEIRFIP